MPTPAQIIDVVAALQNDVAQTKYTDAACLPYLNIALDELQEIFAENNIPTTNDVSAIITVPAGTTNIGYTTTPALPDDLIEIQNLWERQSGVDSGFVPMGRLEFLPQYMEGQEYNSFSIWTWGAGGINLPTAIQDIDLRMDYIKSLFPTPIEPEDIEADLGVHFTNIKSYLGYKTAALCSMYIGENETRAAALNMQAEEALGRALNIPTKSKQAMNYRRRPFRSGYKSSATF